MLLLLVLVLLVIWTIWAHKMYIKDRIKVQGPYINVENVKKGDELEEKVVKLTKEKIPNSKIIRNIIIPNGKKGTTEIDILVVSEFGNLCIECKNYNAKIVGNIKDFQWVLHYGKTQIKKYSPLKQNTRHIFCLRNLVPTQYENIVIFGEKTNLDENLYKNNSIMKIEKFEKFLDKFINLDKIQDERRVENLYDFFKEYQPSEVDKRNHIEYVSSI